MPCSRSVEISIISAKWLTGLFQSASVLWMQVVVELTTYWVDIMRHAAQANADSRGATEDMLAAYKDKPAAPAVPEPEKAPAPGPAAKPAAPAAKVSGCPCASCSALKRAWPGSAARDFLHRFCPCSSAGCKKQASPCHKAASLSHNAARGPAEAHADESHG